MSALLIVRSTLPLLSMRMNLPAFDAVHKPPDSSNAMPTGKAATSLPQMTPGVTVPLVAISLAVNLAMLPSKPAQRLPSLSNARLMAPPRELVTAPALWALMTRSGALTLLPRLLAENPAMPSSLPTNRLPDLSKARPLAAEMPLRVTLSLTVPLTRRALSILSTLPAYLTELQRLPLLSKARATTPGLPPLMTLFWRMTSACLLPLLPKLAAE